MNVDDISWVRLGGKNDNVPRKVHFLGLSFSFKPSLFFPHLYLL
jgi:hypothetical protein